MWILRTSTVSLLFFLQKKKKSHDKRYHHQHKGIFRGWCCFLAIRYLLQASQHRLSHSFNKGLTETSFSYCDFVSLLGKWTQSELQIPQIIHHHHLASHRSLFCLQASSCWPGQLNHTACSLLKGVKTHVAKEIIESTHIHINPDLSHVSTSVFSLFACMLCIENRDTCIPLGVGFHFITFAAAAAVSIIKDSCFFPHITVHVPVQCAFHSNDFFSCPCSFWLCTSKCLFVLTLRSMHMIDVAVFHAKKKVIYFC